MSNYLVVIFKNKVKKKIINKFKTKKRAKKFFDDLINKSNNVIFEKRYENGSESFYNLGLLDCLNKQESKYFKDDLGRQIKLELEDSDYSIEQIERYRIEETILDYKTKNKITTQQLIKKYLTSSVIKMISKINNKIVIQNDDNYDLFTLKNDIDCERFIDSLSEHFIKIGRGDCILVKDVSTTQRKYLYEILVDKGFSKEYLFRHSTTHPI